MTTQPDVTHDMLRSKNGTGGRRIDGERVAEDPGER
jgi:hypothetical protein